MITIIENKKEAKKYTDAVIALFRLYRLNKEISKEDERKELLKIITSVTSGSLYSNEPVKKDIITNHLVGGMPLTRIAEKFNFSNSYIYHLNQAVIKDLAMLIFKILIL